MKLLCTSLVVILAASFAQAEEKCSKDQAKEAVLKMCKVIEEKGDGAKEDLQKFRFCGDNYVWVQDSDVKMVIHPIKPKLNDTDLKPNKDEEGKHLFVEFDKMAKAKKEGGWVDYVWPKPKAEKATPKTSFVKLCGGDKKWIAGSGVWKD
jgi:signal transduction histidine kinase